MQTYEVRLESPSSSQHRILSLAADSEDHAKQIALDKEHALCEFNLHPPAKDVWEDPHLHHEGDGRVDLRLWDQFDPAFAAETAKHTDHDDAKRAAKARLEQWDQRSDLRDGKLLTDLGPRSKARYAAHLQADPFDVVDVRTVDQAEIDANRLVSEARQLAQFDPERWQKVLDQLREGNVPLAAVSAALYGVPTRNRSDGTSNGAILWKTVSGDTFKTAMTTSTYVVGATTLDNDDFFNDITNEITGTGYTAGGATISTPAASYDSTTDQARFDGADVSWTSSTLTARNAIVYKSTGTSTTSPLIGAVDFGADVSTTSGTFSIVWDTTGVWLVDVT